MFLDNYQKFTLRQKISDFAKSIGFDLVGFSPAKIEEKYLVAFEDWLEKGREGTMEYMRKIEQRRDLTKILPGAKSVIVFGLNYFHEQKPLSCEVHGRSQGEVPCGVHGRSQGEVPCGVHGRIARYAYGRDYHKVIGKKLKKVERYIHELRDEMCHDDCMTASHSNQKPARLTKSYVDTGPILERALAEQAGIGRIGKNGCVISKEFGSWIFLSEIITTLDLNFNLTQSEKISSMPVTHPVKLYPGTNFKNTFPGTESRSVSDFQGSPADLQKVFPPVRQADFLPRKAANESHSLVENPAASLSRWSDPAQKSFNVCGNCNKCMTACPTGAIIAPGVVDSRLCISYLTIENKEKIPPALAKIIKRTKLLYGCDICQEVCPHNRARAQASAPAVPERVARGPRTAKNKSFAEQNTLSHERANDPHDPLDGLLTPIAGDSLNIKKLLAKNSPLSTDAAFLRAFAGSPIMRAKRKGLQRNAKIL